MPNYKTMSTSHLVMLLSKWEAENRRKPTRKGTRIIVEIRKALANPRSDDAASS